jgi:two-component sensor histidine kinase
MPITAIRADMSGSGWRAATMVGSTFRFATEGEGLPADFDPRSAAGLGMRIVRAFLQQLNAEIAVRRLDPRSR